MKILYACTALVALSFSAPAFAGGNAQDNVRIGGGSPVVSTFGSCVRTKWTAENDACAAAPAKEPAKVVQKAPAPQKQKIALEQRTVYFDFNKSDIKAEEQEKLDSLVQVIKNSKDIKQATVIGYADAIGKADSNVALSQRRADAVQQYLASKVSIPTSSLVVGGKGATNSVTNCSTKMKRKARVACLAKDRRVELQFNYAQ